MNYTVIKNGDVTTERTIEYIKIGKNRYSYSFTGCQNGNISTDMDKLVIEFKDNYFCLNKNTCSAKDKFVLK